MVQLVIMQSPVEVLQGELNGKQIEGISAPRPVSHTCQETTGD